MIDEVLRLVEPLAEMNISAKLASAVGMLLFVLAFVARLVRGLAVVPYVLFAAGFLAWAPVLPLRMIEQFSQGRQPLGELQSIRPLPGGMFTPNRSVISTTSGQFVVFGIVGTAIPGAPVEAMVPTEDKPIGRVCVASDCFRGEDLVLEQLAGPVERKTDPT